jgi:hypothetical protein
MPTCRVWACARAIGQYGNVRSLYSDGLNFDAISKCPHRDRGGHHCTLACRADLTGYPFNRLWREGHYGGSFVVRDVEDG